MWYKFTAYNSQTQYGWTTNPEVAERALDLLNRKRDVNVYAMTELSDSDDETDGADIPLSKRGIGYVFDDDTSLADIEEWYK